MTDPPRHLDEPTHEWAIRNLPLLRAIFAEFDREANWPSVNVLQKRLVRKGDRVNVSQAAFELPGTLGHREAPPEERIVLSLFALRYVDEARRLLDSFVRFLRMAVERYLSGDEQEPVVVRRADLTETLGLSNSQATKLSHVLVRGGVPFLGGGSIDIETWERTIHEPALVPLLDVHDIDGYLSVVASPLDRRPMQGDATQVTLPLSVSAARNVGGSPIRLHPAIENASLRLFENGHYGEAVEKSYKVVRDQLRALTGYETGAEAFGRGGLRITGAAAPHVADDFNEAVKFLTMAIDRFRNEKSHSSDGHTDNPDRAREYLAMSSLAMHLLDQAEAAAAPLDSS